MPEQDSTPLNPASSFRTISAGTITAAVAKMCTHSNLNLPQDILTALHNSAQSETNQCAREILQQLIDNADIAPKVGLPLCQDTGMAVFFVEMGQDLRISDGGLVQAINEGVRQGYRDGFLRKSICNPFTRENTGDNTPAVIHTELTSGAALRIRFMAKGGGSENMSRVTMLTPAEGWRGIKNFVLQRICEAGGNPCPPIIVGLGVGGSFDTAPIMAKKALLRPLDQPNPDADLRAKEEELLEAINELNIGPMGLGGKTTCLGVRISQAPCHIASLPLAVNIQCHSARHAEIII